jgi:hypothetical protein
MPRRLDEQGRNRLGHTEQAMSNVKIREGVVDFSGMTIHSKPRHAIPDKAVLVGIAVHCTEESHTSTCGFLDDEAGGHHDAYAGKPVNADVNGAYTIIANVAPDAFGKGRAGVVVRHTRQNRRHVA